MKILFQGDSVTDAGRNREDIHHLGYGYAVRTAPLIQAAFPDVEFEFVNLGISGNRTSDLVARLQSDVCDIDADVVILLIGVNDVWHHFDFNIETTPAQFESNLTTVLSAVRQNGAKLLMMEPFMLYGSNKENMYEELDEKIRIIRQLAQSNADAYLPLQAIFAAETVKTPFTAFSDDGVHPNASGSDYIAHRVADEVIPLIASLVEKA